jgi:hypothetical protein
MAAHCRRDTNYGARTTDEALRSLQQQVERRSLWPLPKVKGVFAGVDRKAESLQTSHVFNHIPLPFLWNEKC